jgi:hypothetical protein
MPELRQRMMREMDLRNFAYSTKRAYINSAGDIKPEVSVGADPGDLQLQDVGNVLKSGIEKSAADYPNFNPPLSFALS